MNKKVSCAGAFFCLAAPGPAQEGGAGSRARAGERPPGGHPAPGGQHGEPGRAGGRAARGTPPGAADGGAQRTKKLIRHEYDGIIS